MWRGPYLWASSPAQAIGVSKGAVLQYQPLSKQLKPHLKSFFRVTQYGGFIIRLIQNIHSPETHSTSESLCFTFTSHLLVISDKGLKWNVVCPSNYLVWIICLSVIHWESERDVFNELYWTPLKQLCNFLWRNTHFSYTHVKTSFYMPGLYVCDLLKSLAIFHNLCCCSTLATCINFSNALSLLSKSLWKITQRAALDLGVLRVTCSALDRKDLRENDTAAEKSQSARCEIPCVVVRHKNR